MTEVGSYEAKTHLPQLLARVAKGERISITKHGVPVAMLVPAAPGRARAVSETVAALKEFRKSRRLGGLSLRDLIEEGRR